MDEDVYFKKEVALKHAGETLRFRVSQDLFSSFQVDTGTRFLLRTVALKSHSFRKILDLGCGYGPIGLTLKKLNPDSEVHMVDRDALAVEYSRQNAVLNGLDDVKIYGSLGYDDVAETDFDLIIANIPGRAGEAVIAHFLQDAVYFLKPGGTVAIVVVAPLEKTAGEILKDTPGVDIVFRKDRSGHAVFHYRFSGGKEGAYDKALERGVYDRTDTDFRYGNVHYRMRTAQGLPEFDSLHYKTELLLEGIESAGSLPVKRAIIFNPGQGHIPVFLWKILELERLILIDRDLLALRYSKRNLARNGCPNENISIYHKAGITLNEEEPADIIAGVLREEEGAAAMYLLPETAAEQLSPGGVIVVTGGSTAITRLVEKVHSQKMLAIGERIKRRGYSLLVMKRK